MTTLFAFRILLSIGLFAASPVLASSFAGRDEMNGIRFAPYRDVERKWKMITVRYRHDTRELRFTYANPIAAKTLMNGETDYPDGAVFAKIGAETQEDPSFVSSAIPSGVRRFQLMVRDRKKFASTGGWGYALFDQSGRTFDDDPKVKTAACYACHQLVAAKGDVFSEPFVSGFDPAVRWTRVTASAEVQFERVSVSVLPDFVKTQLPAGTERIFSIKGGLRRSLFQGTLDEVRPLLAKQAARENRIAILASEDFARFSAVIPTERKCGVGAEGRVMEAVYTTAIKDPNGRYQMTRISFCQPKP